MGPSTAEFGFGVKRGNNGKSYRDRPWHHQQLRGCDGRRQAQGHRKCGRGADHALDRRLRQGWRAPDRSAGQAPGGHQPGQHDLRGEAPYRPPLRRSHDQEGHGTRPLFHRQGPQWRRLGQGRRPGLQPFADQRLHAAEDEGNRRILSGRDGHAGGHHRPCLLQRRPASGDQGRRPDRGPGSAAHHQRADRRGAGLWPRQAGRQDDRCL